MQIDQFVWYNENDLISPPYKVQIKRIISKVSGNTQYICKRIADNFRIILLETQLYDTLEQAKEAKIATIEKSVRQLQSTMIDIRTHTDD